MGSITCLFENMNFKGGQLVWLFFFLVIYLVIFKQELGRQLGLISIKFVR